MMTQSHPASDLSRRLARQAHAFCQHFLRAGCRHGHYWLVGDVLGAPGRSLYVRFTGPDQGKGAAGKWTDAATGEHGDLLDLIALNRGLTNSFDAMDAARVFLSLPRVETPCPAKAGFTLVPRNSSEAARRLFAMSQPVCGTLAEKYFQCRSIVLPAGDFGTLRFHPSCNYRDGDNAPTRTYPALIAAVTDNAGRITGVHRTWLDPAHIGEKAPVASPRRALGDLLGFGVRFGMRSEVPAPVIAVGEGLETMMSLRMVMPGMPMVAGLSANHLAALLLPASIERLYVAVDADPAGRGGMQRLSIRARQCGIEVLTLTPQLGDFNEDLRRLGLACLAGHLKDQLVPQDATRFLPAA